MAAGEDNPNKMISVPHIIGKNKGIQGHYNSCYLDATIFSMFAFNTTFDNLLKSRPEKYPKISQSFFNIVHLLRRKGFVPSEDVMKFRQGLEDEGLDTGLTEEEKDPEEFLNLLLDKVFKIDSLLKFTSDESSFIFQIFVEGNPNIKLPTLQYLFEDSLKTSKIQLKTLPENLVLLMPRFGKAFKVYDCIFPSINLDMSEIIKARRHCFVCWNGEVDFQCYDCLKEEVDMHHRLFAYCKECNKLAHKHPRRAQHKPQAIAHPPSPPNTLRRVGGDELFMELYAVICIETSHYVSFTRCEEGLQAKWCFFDSMADREGDDVHGINIPEVVNFPDPRHWLTEQGYQDIIWGAKPTPLVQRMLKDVYMCMYRRPSTDTSYPKHATGYSNKPPSTSK